MNRELAKGKAGPGIELPPGRAGTVAFLVLFCLAYRPAGINTESLTMSTYYPAPFGVYEEMRTLRDVYLSYENGGNNAFQVGVGVSNPTAGARMHVLGFPGGNPPLAVEDGDARGNFMGMRFRRAGNQSFLEFGTKRGNNANWQFETNGEPNLDMVVGPPEIIPPGPGNFLRMNDMYMGCRVVPYRNNAETRCPRGLSVVAAGPAVVAGRPACTAASTFCSGSEQREMRYEFVDNSGRRHLVRYQAFQYPPREGFLTCCNTRMRRLN